MINFSKKLSSELDDKIMEYLLRNKTLFTEVSRENPKTEENYYGNANAIERGNNDDYYGEGFGGEEGHHERVKKAHFNNGFNEYEENNYHSNQETRPLHDSSNLINEYLSKSNVKKTAPNYKDTKFLATNGELYSKNNQLRFTNFSMQLLGRSKKEEVRKERFFYYF